MRKIARLFAAALLLGLSPGLAVAQMRQQVPDRLGTEAFSQAVLTESQAGAKLRSATLPAGERTAPTTRQAILGTYIQDSHGQQAGAVTFMGELTISAGTGANDVSIANFYNAGGTFAGTVNPAAGTITFQPGQIVGTLSDGSTLKLYPADFANLHFFNQPFDAVVSPKGIIRFPEMIIIAEGATSGQIRCYGDEWYRYNAQMTDHSLWNTDKPVNTYSIHYSRTTPTQLLIKNFGGHGAAIKCTVDTVGNVTVPRTAIGAGQTSSGSMVNLYNYNVTAIDRTKNPPVPTLNSNAMAALFAGDSIVTGPWCVAAGTGSTSARADLLERSVIRVSADEAWTNLSTAVDFAGKGTAEEPYLIATAADLQRLSFVANNNTALRVNKVVLAGKHFAQTADIDLGDVETFEPIGGTADYKFGGIYDGRGHAIAGLKVSESRGTSYRAGLFGELAPGAAVHSLTLDRPVIRSAQSYAGSVAGYSAAHVHDIKVAGADVAGSSLSGSYYGGVLGFSVNAAVTEDITVQGGSVTGADFVSSIVGNCNGAKIRRCVSNMDVVRLPSNQASPRYGGIAPVITRDTAVVEDCLYYGTIRLYGNEIAGGIVGNPTAGQIRRCQFAGQVLHQASSSSTAIIGGITGKQEKGGVHDCQSSGIIQSYLGTTIGGITAQVTNAAAEISGNLFTGTLMVSGSVRGNEITADPGEATLADNYFDAQTSYNFGTTGATPTATLSSGTLPKGLDAAAWTPANGKYPVLTALRNQEKVQLDAVPFFLGAADNQRNVRSAFTLGTGENVSWHFLHDMRYTTAGNGLAISGTSVSLTATALCSDTLVAVNADGQLFRMYCLKVVPKEFDGEGTAASPYLIRNKADLDKVFHAVDTELYDYTGTHFRVEGDIDFAGVQGFRGYSNTAPAYAFNGVLDGNGHTIRNLVQAVPTSASVTGAFMVYTGPASEVKNFTVDRSCRFVGGSYVGFVAQAHGLLQGIVNLADVTAYNDGAAGIACQLAATGKVTGCYNAGRIRGARRYTAGIVGIAARGSEIRGCQNSGNVTNAIFGPFSDDPKQLIYTGGILGKGAGNVSDCLNQGMIVGADHTGGIAGDFTANAETGLQGCVNTGIVLENGTDGTRGAIIGSPYGNDQSLVRNNYYDAQFSALAAAANNAHAGVRALQTAQLTAGSRLEGCDDALWQFAAGSYPVLKAFASQPASQWYAAARVEFATSPRVESRFDKRTEAVVRMPRGTVARLADGTVFAIADGKLVNPTSKAVATDTLTLTSDDGLCTLSAPLFGTPRLLDNGTGTAADPYVINTPTEWNTVAFYANEYHKPLSQEHFRLGADLDFNGNFEPICSDGSTLFAGTIDGNGKRIIRAVYDNEDMKYVGLLGRASADAKVYDLTLDTTVSFVGNQYVGGVAGSFAGEAYGIVNHGYMKAAKMQYAGGVAGTLATGARVHDCVNHGEIWSKSNGGGGIAGSTDTGADVRDCSNYGLITSAGSAGGIIGSTKSPITDCRNFGRVVSTSGSCGGIVGYVWPTEPFAITGCENTGEVSATSAGCGGIAGSMQNSAYIRDCVNRADVTSTGNYAGGILGQASTSNSSWRLERCENFGDVIATYGAGGVMGYSNSGSADEAPYLDSVANHGSVTASKTYYAGGIIGAAGTRVQIRNAWNHGPSVQATTYGAGGIAGSCTGSVINAYNQADVTAGTYSAAGIVGQSNTSTVTDYGCRISGAVNVGKVQSLGTTDANSFKIAGILGYGWATVENCVNQGDLKGRKNVAGIVGLPIKGKNATTPGTQVLNCYNVGRVECTVAANAKTCGMVVGNNTTAVTYVNYANNYYDSQMAGTSTQEGYADHSLDGVTPLSTAALAKADLGDGFTANADGYPVIKAHADKAYAPLAFSAVVLPEGSHADNVLGSFHVSQAAGLSWAAKDMTFTQHGTATWSSADLSNLTPLTATLGDSRRTVYLKLAATTGVDGIANDADVREVQWYDLRGTRLSGPSQGVNVRITIFSDGTTRSEKVMVKE